MKVKELVEVLFVYTNCVLVDSRKGYKDVAEDVVAIDIRLKEEYEQYLDREVTTVLIYKRYIPFEDKMVDSIIIYIK